MGKLRYANLEFEGDDTVLFHIDVLLARLGGTPFQMHFMPTGEHDAKLISLAITPGVPISLEYYNGPELRLDVDAIDRAIETVQAGSLLDPVGLFYGKGREVGA